MTELERAERRVAVYADMVLRAEVVIEAARRITHAATTPSDGFIVLRNALAAYDNFKNKVGQK